MTTPPHMRPLPTGWRWAKLGELAVYVNGCPFRPEEWRDSGLPIIRIQNLTDPVASFNYYQGDLDPRYSVFPGDLLVSWSASLDAFIWDGGPAVLNQHIFKVEERPSLTCREFLYYAIKQAMVDIRSRIHGGTMQHITKPAFESTLTPLPPLAEQKRIAALLTEQLAAVDRACAAAEAQLAAAQALPTAFLRELLNRYEVQTAPTKPLRELVSFLPARAICNIADAHVTVITTACLTETGFDPAGLKTARMWHHDVTEATARPGEILVARSNTPDLVGRVALFEGPASGVVSSDLTIRMWPLQQVHGPFLSAYLSYLYLTGFWRQRSGGTSGTMKKITRTQLAHLPIPLPPLSTQEDLGRDISARANQARLLASAIEAQRAAILDLPIRLLSRAFNGEL